MSLKQVKSRKVIGKLLSQKVKRKNQQKIKISRSSGLSRHIVDKVLQQGNQSGNYSIDTFLKLCKELEISVYIEV